MYIHLKKDLNYSAQDINNLTALQVAMITQREAEPVYKREIDEVIRKNKNG